jgi:hypothetical protein
MAQDDIYKDLSQLGQKVALPGSPDEAELDTRINLSQLAIL